MWERGDVICGEALDGVCKGSGSVLCGEVEGLGHG